MPTRFDQHEDTALAPSRAKIKPPPMYRVVLLNDDFTTMDFVIYVLQNVFGKSEAEAFELMLKVHTEGAATAGIYTRDIAETKAEKTIDLARQHEHPLMCRVEEE